MRSKKKLPKKLQKKSIKERALKPALKAMAEVDETAPAIISFVEAGKAEPGAYLSWGLHDVVELNGQRVTRPAVGYEEVKAIGYSENGDKFEWWLPGHCPLRVDAAGVERVLAEHKRKRAVVEGRLAPRARAQTVEVVDESGNVTFVERPRKERKARTATSPLTACQEGTSGHAVGLILLRQKPKGFDRAKAIAAAMKELSMEKGLASSWVSTLIKRKAPFAAYGGGK